MCVNFLHRLRLLLTKQAHCTHRMSLPIWPITAESTKYCTSQRRVKLKMWSSEYKYKGLTHFHLQRAPCHLQTAPPPMSSPTPAILQQHNSVNGEILFLFNQKRNIQTSTWAYQVIDDIEAVVVVVSGVYSSMLLFSHVIFQGGFVPECLLTVQTLHAI